MMNNEDVFSTLKVVKRNGKKVNFDETKIAIAIKKALTALLKTEKKKIINIMKKIFKKFYKTF